MNKTDEHYANLLRHAIHALTRRMGIREMALWVEENLGEDMLPDEQYARLLGKLQTLDNTPSAEPPAPDTPLYNPLADKLLVNALEYARLSEQRVVLYTKGMTPQSGYIRRSHSGHPILCARRASKAGHLIIENQITKVMLRTGRVLWKE